MASTATYPQGLIVPTADIDRGFADGTLFGHSAWRLELLDWYTSPAARSAGRIRMSSPARKLD